LCLEGIIVGSSENWSYQNNVSILGLLVVFFSFYVRILPIHFSLYTTEQSFGFACWVLSLEDVQVVGLLEEMEGIPVIFICLFLSALAYASHRLTR